MRLTRITAIALIAILSLSVVACGWTGPNGENEHEYVECHCGYILSGYQCYIAGGDGDKLELVNNPDAKDPTWDELKSFLAQDNTNQHLYITDSFVCADFAEMLHNNAEAAGIRAAYVSVELECVYTYQPKPTPPTGCPSCISGSHACNAFQTTDRGLIYIDDTGDENGTGLDCTVNISDGHPYTLVPIFSNVKICQMGNVECFSMQW